MNKPKVLTNMVCKECEKTIKWYSLAYERYTCWNCFLQKKKTR